MATYDIFPDIEHIVTDWLVTWAWDATTPDVGTRFPTDAVLPVLIIQRVGGLPVERHRLDRARLQVDVWAETKATALAIASEARVALHSLEGQSIVNPAAFIAAVNDDLGLSWLFDTQNYTPRYTFGVNMVYHASPVVGS